MAQNKAQTRVPTSGLAASCLSGGADVLPGQRVGDGLCLDGRGAHVARALHRSQQRPAQAQLGEEHLPRLLRGRCLPAADAAAPGVDDLLEVLSGPVVLSLLGLVASLSLGVAVSCGGLSLSLALLGLAGLLVRTGGLLLSLQLFLENALCRSTGYPLLCSGLWNIT
jgi:hypothetical protein